MFIPWKLLPLQCLASFFPCCPNNPSRMWCAYFGWLIIRARSTVCNACRFHWGHVCKKSSIPFFTHRVEYSTALCILAAKCQPFHSLYILAFASWGHYHNDKISNIGSSEITQELNISEGFSLEMYCLHPKLTSFCLFIV